MEWTGRKSQFNQFIPLRQPDACVKMNSPANPWERSVIDMIAADGVIFA